MSTTPQFEIPTDVRKITEKSVEQVKTAISGYLHFLQRARAGKPCSSSRTPYQPLKPRWPSLASPAKCASEVP